MGTSRKAKLMVTAASASTVSATTFNRNFTSMALLKSVTTKGTGGIGAIMPHTVSSIRYVERDAPYPVEALKDAGLPASDMSVVNAHCGDATEFSNAQADITKGDKVLITTDSAEHKAVPPVLLTPKWVTTQNMASTVIANCVGLMAHQIREVWRPVESESRHSQIHRVDVVELTRAHPVEADVIVARPRRGYLPPVFGLDPARRSSDRCSVRHPTVRDRTPGSEP